MASPPSTSHQQGLPSISSLTNGLPPSNAPQQYAHGDQQQGEPLRDSGTWPQPHSKRECFACFFLSLPSGLLGGIDDALRSIVAIGADQPRFFWAVATKLCLGCSLASEASLKNATSMLVPDEDLYMCSIGRLRPAVPGSPRAKLASPCCHHCFLTNTIPRQLSK